MYRIRGTLVLSQPIGDIIQNEAHDCQFNAYKVGIAKVASCLERCPLCNNTTATAGSDVVQSGRPIFDDFFQHLWPYIGNNTANVVFQMVKRLWRIRIDQ
ncbi:hypothetical protein TNCV_2578781 [Trichonephila clavipes]|nr:hypothetical protein TNCV_2578781 [Trichonephila clavipes]